MHSRKSAFTLIEIMVMMAIAGILLTVAVTKLIPLIDGADRTVLEAQAKTYQDKLNLWVTEQKSIGAAIAQFDASGSPKNTQSLVDALNRYIQTDVDKATVNDDGTIATEKMRSASAYMTITWPTPMRDNYARINLVIPES